MPKFEINIDANYRRITQGASDIRTTLRDKMHQPEKRATTRTLFLIGVATVVVGGCVLAVLR